MGNLTKIFKSIKTSKKGNLTVLLSMIFVSLVFMVFVFIKYSAHLATVSYANDVLELAGRAILSEYHSDLKNTYGIFAFEGFEKETKSDLEFYIDKSFNNKEKSKGINMIRPKLQELAVDFQDFALMDVENFREEIVSAYPYIKTKPAMGYGKISYSKGELINERIKKELPSYCLGTKGYDLTNPIKVTTEIWNKGLSTLTSETMMNEYILNMCNCNTENKSPVYTFFQNEIEYILYGYCKDEQNKAEFLKQFKTIRFTLNSAHIYADTEKRNKVLTAAETITPGPEAVVTAAILAELWAAMETSNDKELLIAGKGVALKKDTFSWAIDFQSVLDKFLQGSSDSRDGKYIEPEKESDMGYKEYLKIFLCCQEDEVKLIRLMDLIQLNIQGNFDDSFRIKDCYLGLMYEAKINGQKYKYIQNY